MRLYATIRTLALGVPNIKFLTFGTPNIKNHTSLDVPKSNFFTHATLPFY